MGALASLACLLPACTGQGRVSAPLPTVGTPTSEEAMCPAEWQWDSPRPDGFDKVMANKELRAPLGSGAYVLRGPKLRRHCTGAAVSGGKGIRVFDCRSEQVKPQTLVRLDADEHP